MRHRRHLHLHVVRRRCLWRHVAVGVVRYGRRSRRHHVRAGSARVGALGQGLAGRAPAARWQAEGLAQAVAEGRHEQHIDERVGDGVESRQQ